MAKRKSKAVKRKDKKQDAFVQAIVIIIVSILLAVLIYVQSRIHWGAFEPNAWGNYGMD